MTHRTEPPVVADELTMLTAFLDYYRATLLRQTEGVSDAELEDRLAPSSMTLGGLLSHLAWVEDWWFGVHLAGRDEDALWAGADWESDQDWEWSWATGRSGDELRAALLAAVERSRADVAAAVAAGGADAVAARAHPQHGAISLRWILVHMVEEYARHCGHADLIRESIDGATDL